MIAFVPPLLGLLLAPLLLGVIHRTKAFFAGRQGPPLLQLYYDLGKLLRKGAVYSRTTSWVFRAGPVVALVCTVAALMLLPLLHLPAPLSFAGDFVVMAYLLGLARLFIVLAALDTGSSFEGMGASREVQFSALAEPALLLGLGTLVLMVGDNSLSGMLGRLNAGHWLASGPSLILVVAALFLVLLAENARIPVDDPNTHLELTMIHEVMVLDHGGPDFALIQYAAALKLWLFAALVASVALPLQAGSPWLTLLTGTAAVMVIGMGVGVVESTMARLRLLTVPQFLWGATVLAAVALLLAASQP
ncbi:MAG: NADH-quinone oxidoreductase subunit H [Verrucomicrobiae bacterium]|nr:NADH-quinone oxidoreductase subunit H [Verrucomicrobiae bacterium]